MSLPSRRQHTFRCKDQFGDDVLITVALTSDRRMIAVKRSTTTDPVFVRPESISRIVEALRDLQAQALEGETWDV